MTVPEFVMWAISGLIMLLASSYGWFITNTLRKIDANQEKMSEMLMEQVKAIAKLQAEHEMLLKQYYERRA